MRTIAFYSHRGGVGKSLAAANLAVCLSRLGRNCALIDWDLDAPSMHQKIGVGEPALGLGGIVRLIEDSIVLRGNNRTLQLKDWNQSTLEDVVFKTVTDLTPYSDVLEDLRERAAFRKEYGKIRFFPAGNIYVQRYWTVVWSSLWRDIFTVWNRANAGFAEQDDVDRIITFLNEIKAGVAATEEKPEYLIIDCRAGASDLISTLLTSWLTDAEDKLIYHFAFNDDSISYLERALALFPPEVGKRISLVLCRVPTSIEYGGDRKLKAAMYRAGISWEDLKVLHSDRDLEGEERLRLGRGSPAENRRLTIEYLEIFQTLIPREHWLGKDTLAKAIGLEGTPVEETERLFNLDAHAGALINPNDHSRNVSFKVETFQLLLQGLEQGIDTTAHHLDGFRSQLSFAGTQAGRRFGESLRNRLVDPAEVYPQEKIRKWCQFDSDVGWGRFELDPKSVGIDGLRLSKCDVILHESFLTPSTDTQFRSGDHVYCDLMLGYVKGVLEKLLNLPKDALSVVHEAIPIAEGARSESCRFKVRGVVGQTSDDR